MGVEGELRVMAARDEVDQKMERRVEMIRETR
jgi:hypothetical protein